MERSPYIAERRRKLFESSECEEEDFGVNTLEPLSPKICRMSPTENLKTPHDQTTGSVKLEQKSILEQSKSGKRPNTSPRPSKVRTALFPEQDAFSFYSKVAKQLKKRPANVLKPIKFTSQRATRPIRVFGTINKGVCHKIRKPKPTTSKKKINFPKITNQSSDALTEYIKDLAELKNGKPKKTTIQQPRTTTQETNKENIMEDFDEDFQEQTTDISNLIARLSEDEGEPIQLKAHTSVLTSDTSILLHPEHAALLSPISQMCDVTSGLALNSPDAANGQNQNTPAASRRVSKVLTFDGTTTTTTSKLFPVFNNRGQKRLSTDVPVKQRQIKRFKQLPKDQMLLDAGQKRLGIAQCDGCGLVYEQGNPNEELEHIKRHSGRMVLTFPGWKHESIVADFQTNGRIIRIQPNDPMGRYRKVADVLEFIKNDLGGIEIDITNAHVYFYIKNKTIAGCAIANQPLEGGHKKLDYPGDIILCSEESYPIKCGISILWVAPDYRRCNIATSLLDTIKSTFYLTEVLTNDDLALTTPTNAGAAFAVKYFQKSDYLIYFK